MQESSTADLVHSVPALVAYLSKLMTLEPGDIVSTGTPAGRRQHARPEGVAEARRRGRGQLAAARRARRRRLRLGRRSRRRGRARRPAGRRCGAPPRSGRSRRATGRWLGSQRDGAAVGRTRARRRSAWSRLRSSCSASRITPQSSWSRRRRPARRGRRARRRRARPCGGSGRSGRSGSARAG